MRKFLLSFALLVAGVMTVGAQEPVLELTKAQIGNYPYELNAEDAEKVFGLDDLTIAVSINTPASVSGRRALFATSDPTKEANSSAEGKNSRYVAYGMNGADAGYLASWRSGDRFTGGGGITANAVYMVVVYVINPTANTFKAYINGVEKQSKVNVHADGFMSGYEIATPKMVKADHENAKIYIGGGKHSGGDSEVFDGAINGVKVFSGALTAEQIAAIEFPNQETFRSAATANVNMNIFGLQRYLGLVQDANKYVCNYPSDPADGQGYPGLLDNDFNTYFHSGYSDHNPSPSDVAHYLQADLGKAVKSFRFYTRKRNGNDRPTKITIEGSNDAEDWQPVTVVQNIPTTFDDFYSEAITSATAYKHYRFTVNTTNTNKEFFTFSEFYILPNTPKVAATFDAVRAYREDATVETATALNEVYEWHQEFAGDAYPDDLYEGVYTLTINGPVAANATYNGEKKTLPATFYVTEEVEEENAAVAIASDDLIPSFYGFTNGTSTMEVLTVTSLAENKEYTAIFSYSLELKESTGRFTDGSKVWSFTPNETYPVPLTFTSNANNMKHEGGYIHIHPGQVKTATYDIDVPAGYTILEYSFDYAFGNNTNATDRILTVGNEQYSVTSESQTLPVQTINANTARITLTGTNQAVKLTNFVVKVKLPVTEAEIASYKTVAKNGVNANIGEGVGKYSYTANGEKLYIVADVKTAIDNAETVAEVCAITESYALNMPETGKFYRLKNNQSGWYATSDIRTGETQYNNKLYMANENNTARTVWYLTDDNKFLSYTKGQYLGDMSSDWSFETVGAEGNVVTFNESTVAGKYQIIPSSGRALYGDQVRVDAAGATNNSGNYAWTIEEVTWLPVEINPEVGYATLYSPVELGFYNRVTAYTASLSEDKEWLKLVEQEVVPANTGVVLTFEEGVEVEEENDKKYVYLPVQSTSVNNVTSDLAGTFETKSATGVYTLQQNKSGEGVVFGQYTGTYVNGFKAYLELPAGAGAISIRFEGSTDIENVEIRNEKSEMIFDLLGRRVETMTKGGIYIVNGKKVVVK